MGGQAGMGQYGGGGGGGWNEQPWGQMDAQMYQPQQNQQELQNMLGSMGSAYGSAAQNQPGMTAGMSQWQPPPSWESSLYPGTPGMGGGGGYGGQLGGQLGGGGGMWNDYISQFAPNGGSYALGPTYGFGGLDPWGGGRGQEGGINQLIQGIPGFGGGGPDIASVSNTLADMGGGDRTLQQKPGLGAPGAQPPQRTSTTPMAKPETQPGTPPPSPYDAYQARNLRGIE